MDIREFNQSAMLGKEVRVYRNLRNKLLSVQAKVKGSWLVIGHTNSINLCAPRFVVSKAGRDRVIREQRKNVHAFVIGTVTDETIGEGCAVRQVTYNPYRFDSFVEAENLHQVDCAQLASISITTGIKII
jgi:hypothetical protein